MISPRHQPLLAVWRQALDSPNGVAIKCSHLREARSLRFRLLQARAAERIHHLDLYPVGHEMHGKSHYEHLQTAIDATPTTARVVITQVPEPVFEIEELA